MNMIIFSINSFAKTSHFQKPVLSLNGHLCTVKGVLGRATWRAPPQATAPRKAGPGFSQRTQVGTVPDTPPPGMGWKGPLAVPLGQSP